MRSNFLMVLVATLIIGVPFSLVGQDFTDLQVQLPGIENGVARWGDFDGDGDLDILLAGSGITQIVKNDQGNFVATADSFPGVSQGSADWGDYDNDGDLDFLLTGYTNNGTIARVYQNNAGTYMDAKITLPGVGESAVSWVDYDNDGDLDILLTGVSENKEISKIYQNDNGSLTETTLILPAIKSGAVAWGDYDKDGDLDLLMAGNSSPEPVSEVFRNDQGRFRIHNLQHIWCYQSSVAWSDYDNDGDLDALIAGIDWYDFFRVAKIFKNHNNEFTDAGISLVGIYDGSSAWGDYDNDGDSDLLLTGSGTTDIYRNENGNFIAIRHPLVMVSNSSASWGDYDQDGDLDIVLTGRYASIPITRVYRNNFNRPNRIPQTPASLSAQVKNHSACLSWHPGADTETPQKSLTYNLRIGTAPGKCDVISPMACMDNTSQNGQRKIVALGNANHNCQWTIYHLAAGQYYWSVQAIDQGFAGSPFAPEQSFIIPMTGVASKIP